MKQVRGIDCERSFATEEYDSLREEMIARIEAINSQASSALTSILTAWASAIALLVLSFSDTVSDTRSVIGFDIALSLALFIPLLCLFPLAIKSGENLTQIVSISCYIRIFFENTGSVGEKLFAWENANNAISRVNVKREGSSFGDFR